jgi:hypothetical protein
VIKLRAQLLALPLRLAALEPGALDLGVLLRAGSLDLFGSGGLAIG